MLFLLRVVTLHIRVCTIILYARGNEILKGNKVILSPFFPTKPVILYGDKDFPSMTITAFSKFMFLISCEKLGFL